MSHFNRFTTLALLHLLFAATLSAGVAFEDFFENYSWGIPLTSSSGSKWREESGGGGQDVLVQLSNNNRCAEGGGTSGVGQDVYATFQNQQFRPVYCGFDVRFPSTGTRSTAFMHFGDSNSSRRFQVFATKAGSSVRIGIASDAYTVSQEWSSIIFSSSTVRVMLRFHTSTGEMKLWVDPTSESDTHITDQSSGGAGDVSRISLRQEDQDCAWRIDNLIVATTWNEAWDKRRVNLVSIDKDAGPTAGGQQVTLNGVDLDAASRVEFGGESVSSPNFISQSANQIVLLTPAHPSPGVVGVVVRQGTGGDSLSNAYEYVAAPRTDQVSPVFGPDTGGTSITLSGFNFDAPGTVEVSVGGNLATNVSVTSPTSLTCTTPAGSAGTSDIVVTTIGGSHTLPSAFTFTNSNPPAPTLTALAPSSGSISGGTAVRITGSNLNGTSAVDFGGMLATSIVVVSPTEVNVTTPAHAAGLVNVTITTPGGSDTLTGGFNYTTSGGSTLPTITSVTPNSGSVNGGETVVISGTNLSNITSVTFGGANGTGLLIISSTSLQVVTPAFSAGSVDVVISDSFVNETAPNAFTYTSTSGGGTPSITLAASLVTFEAVIGEASLVQQYTVMGSNLSGPVQVSAPLHFEVSLDAMSGFSRNSVSLVPTNGALSVTVFARFNPLYDVLSASGNITHQSAGASSRVLSLNGLVTSEIVTSLSSLNSFATTAAGVPSASQSYGVSGSDLPSNITLTAPAHFQLSSDNVNFNSTLTLSAINGSVATSPVFVRFNPSSGTNAYVLGEIEHRSGGLLVKVAVLGVIGAPQTTTPVIQLPASSPFTIFRAPQDGEASQHQTYAFIGSNLTAPVTVSAPTGFELSSNLGTSWHAQVSIAQSGGSTGIALIWVRFHPSGLGTSSAAGSITHASTGASTVSLNVLGAIGDASASSGTTTGGGSGGGGCALGTIGGNAALWLLVFASSLLFVRRRTCA